MYLKVISEIKEINKILNILKYFMKKFSQELKKCLGIRKARISKSNDNSVLSTNLKTLESCRLSREIQFAYI